MSSRGGHSRNEIDWICPDPKCGNSNFARRDKCNRCGTGKPRESSSGKTKSGGFELGKDLADKSKGLFSADDWQCKTCGNVNWARRGTCNLCNSPKVGQVEERTGFGGGFMERDEVPDKIQHHSDDEEYDEFGRKKKKYRGSVDAAPSRPAPPPAPVEDDDEEEEDSDDDDLGAYAFDSDDAEEVKRESAKANAGRNRSESSKSSYSSRSRDGSSERSRSRGSRKRDSRARSRSSSSSSDSSRGRGSRGRSRSRSPIRRK